MENDDLSLVECIFIIIVIVAMICLIVADEYAFRLCVVVDLGLIGHKLIRIEEKMNKKTKEKQ